MKRLTMRDLERMAFAHPGTKIEVDEANGVAVLQLGRGRATYYARLADEPAEPAAS